MGRVIPQASRVELRAILIQLFTQIIGFYLHGLNGTDKNRKMRSLLLFVFPKPWYCFNAFPPMKRRRIWYCIPPLFTLARIVLPSGICGGGFYRDYTAVLANLAPTLYRT